MIKQPKKILIRGVNWIGDAVLTIPSVRSIKKSFPSAHIAILVNPLIAQIFKENPDVDEIIIYGDNHKGVKGRFILANMLRSKKFDTAILLQNAFDAAFIAWLARIPERIGYSRDFRRPLLTKAIPVRKDIVSQHQVYYYLDLLNSIGIKTAETQPYLFLTSEERQLAKNMISLKDDKTVPLIGINPGATYGSAKRWPAERFAEVIARIVDHLNGRVIIFGSPSETDIADEIVSLVRKGKPAEFPAQGVEFKGLTTESKPGVLDMSGKTDIRELASLISLCDAFITNDSGPMHIASALLVPTVAVFGSTNSRTTGPFGEGHKTVSKNLPCAPCMKRECPEKHLRCMTEISSDGVFEALREMLPLGKAVFLDRDGTIIEDRNYLNSFDDLFIFPEAEESLNRLKEKGFKLIGITNQSGIARKLVSEDFVIKSNAFLKEKLGIDDFYYCPHHPDEQCACRKPEPMLILRARIEHKISLRASYVIGDKESDVLLAHNVNATGILLAENPSDNTTAAFVAKNMQDAVEWIIDRESGR